MSKYELGEIFWIEFSDNSIGHEFRGRRPAVIIQSDTQIEKSNTITIMPLTGNLDNKMPDDILVSKNSNNNLFTDSIIKVYYIMSFDKSRFIKKIGILDNSIIEEIQKYFKKHFKFS